MIWNCWLWNCERVNMNKRGSKKIFNDFVKSVREDPKRYFYIHNNLNKMKEEDIDINTQGYNGNTLLHLALRLNDLRLFNIFLEAGVNPDLANDSGDAPIHLAVIKGKKDFIRSLIKYHCDINNGSELEQTPLHLAVITGNLEIVKYLVEQKADILLLDEINNLPIDYAIDEKDIRIIEYLLSKQEVDEERKTKINMILHKEGN